jgi:hypothetical protein
MDTNIRIVEGHLEEPRPMLLPMTGRKFAEMFGIMPDDPLKDLEKTIQSIGLDKRQYLQ